MPFFMFTVVRGRCQPSRQPSGVRYLQNRTPHVGGCDEPLFMAPIGVQGILHADAELATARAAKNLGVPLIMSSASSRSIEEVAQAIGDGLRWFQLYWLTLSSRLLCRLNSTRSDDLNRSVSNEQKITGSKFS
jgi:FMN-dependent dehydrogenase